MDTKFNSSRLRRLYFVVEKKKQYIFCLFILLIFIVTAVSTWGRMQMGDSSVELVYGQMIGSGLVPYQDFYMHVMPITSYLAVLLEKASAPIHAVNIVGWINLLIGISSVLAISRLLKLSFLEKVLGSLVFFGLYLITLPNFNHHSFDVTLSALGVLFLLYLIRSTASKPIFLWAGLAALVSVINFFVTQTYGLAAMVLGPLVLIVAYLLSKDRLNLKKFLILAPLELLVFLFVILSFIGFGRINVSQMFRATFTTGYQQYTGTYGYGTIWKTSIDNIKSFYYKHLPKSDDLPVIDSGTSISDREGTSFTGPSIPNNIFFKIFLKKSAFLYSLFSLIALALIIFMALQFIGIFYRQLVRKESADPIFLVWGGVLGIFFASSILVFQINFSAFYVIFLLWLYILKQPYSIWPTFGYGGKVTISVLAVLLLVSNVFILCYEFKTKEYFISQTAQESVWVSPFYHKDFISQFKEMALVVNKQPDIKNFVAYPRASEIYYLLNRVPPKGFPLASFYRPGGAYQDTLQGAQNSDVLVVFEPKFYANDLGEEHNFAIKQLQPTLDRSFSLLFSNSYFKVYKHI